MTASPPVTGERRKRRFFLLVVWIQDLLETREQRKDRGARNGLGLSGRPELDWPMKCLEVEALLGR